MIKRLGTLMIAAVLVAAPAASASGKHLKLTAIVTGQKSETIPIVGMGKVTLYSVKQGSKKVGTLAVSPSGGCAGDTCPAAGLANLKVGRVTGKAYLKTTTMLTGCSPGCGPGHPTKFLSNTGHILIAAKHESEAIRVNGSWPDLVGPVTKGAKVTFVLSY